MAQSENQATPIGVRVPWLVVLIAWGGTEVLPGERVELNQLPAEPNPVDVAIWTKFEDVGLAAALPRELVVEVRLDAQDADAAVAEAGAVATGLAAMISFCVNAFIGSPEPTLAYEVAPAIDRRRFWQRYLADQQPDVLRPSRRIDPSLLFPFLTAVFASKDADRIGRAVSHYHVALGQWTTRGQPLALAHLYMALEALGPVAERREREGLGLADEKAHAEHRGVDTSKSNWREVLLGWVRRDVLCGGDKATYDAARKASDGFEHGFMPLPEYRSAATTHTRALLDHVRSSVLRLLDLDEAVYQALVRKTAVDITPLWLEVRGELHGNVQDPDAMAEDGYTYPSCDWKVTLDDAHRTEDNRLRISPRNHLTAHMADGVQMTFTHHGGAVGLNDLETFEFEPSDEEPQVIPREEPNGDPRDASDPGNSTR